MEKLEYIFKCACSSRGVERSETLKWLQLTNQLVTSRPQNDETDMYLICSTDLLVTYITYYIHPCITLCIEYIYTDWRYCNKIRPWFYWPLFHKVQLLFNKVLSIRKWVTLPNIFAN